MCNTNFLTKSVNIFLVSPQRFHKKISCKILVTCLALVVTFHMYWCKSLLSHTSSSSQTLMCTALPYSIPCRWDLLHLGAEIAIQVTKPSAKSHQSPFQLFISLDPLSQSLETLSLLAPEELSFPSHHHTWMESLAF